ncbi:MAG: ORF6N domain-containing protein [Rectinemataceae bacterium]|nr:ORF6N domain-containing protein [Rectinemataceae bacterium]
MKKGVGAGTSVTSMAQVEQRIFLIRGQAVMLDAHLAELYEVETKALTRAVKRNIERFPGDFMFQLSKDEAENLISQFGASSWGGRRYLPYVFTEQGVAMLSGVLRSARAIQVNIEIMRAFIRMKKALIADKELARRMDAVEKTVTLHGQRVQVLSDLVRGMIEPPTKAKRKIGFRK